MTPLKPKTLRRLTLLALVAFLVVGGAFSLLVVRRWQNNRVTQAFGDEALAAHQKGNHFVAMNAAGSFIKRAKPSDPRYVDLQKVYADERLKVEEPNFDHVKQAIGFYRLYLERRPEDRATKVLLLDLFTKAGFFAEARDLANDLLPADLSKTTIADAPILRSEAISLFGTLPKGAPDARLIQVLDRLAELQPLNTRNESIRLEWFKKNDRPGDGRAHADALLAAHPADPRAEVLVVISRMIDRRADEGAEQQERICRAAGLDPQTATRTTPAAFPDMDFAESLVEVFDQVNAFEHSLQVLQDAVAAFDDPDLKRTLVRRLWQDGRFQEVDSTVGKLDPASPDSDAELLGFRAISLYALNRPKEAHAIADALAPREGYFKAITWSKAIPLADPENKTPAPARIDQLRDIVKANPNEPLFLFMLGDALAAAGRAEEARKYWEDAGGRPFAVSWPTPWARIAETALNEGRPEEAARAATRALSKAPRRAALNLLWFDAEAALVQRGSSEAAPLAEIMKRLDQTEAGLAQVSSAEGTRLRDRLLPARILLLAHSGNPEASREAARAALQGALASNAELSENTLRRLAAISESEHLGLEQECLARAESKFGQTAGVALSRALELASAGNPDAGLAKLRESAQAHTGDLSYQVALARYLERIGHPDAIKTWRALGDANTASLEAQRAILTSDAAVGDRPLIEKTIQRYTALLGEGAGEDYYARMARARTLVHGSPTRKDRDEAVAILGSLVSAEPSLSEPKILLAQVLALSDPSRDITPDLPRAVAQLSDAAAREPRSARVALELARIYQAQRDWDKAKDQLVRVASGKEVDPDSRAEAARLLIAQGEPGPVAIATLSEIASQLGDRAAPGFLLMLAQCHVMLREDDKAAPVYDALVQRAHDPDSILMAASFYSKRSVQAKADAALARLDSMNLSAGIKDLTLARYAAERGSTDDAKARFEAAVAAAPTRVDGWRHFISFWISRDPAQAVAVAQRALKAVPGDPTLTALAERARLVAADPSSADVDALVETLAKDPASVEAAKSISLIQQAQKRGQLGSLGDLVALADRYPTNAAVQMFAARRVAAADPDRAAIIAARAMAAAPADPAAAKLAAEVYLRAERWNDLLDAANAWRQRDPSRSPEPDIAIAEAYYNLKDYTRGLDALAPRVATAAAKPTEPFALQVLNTDARLLIAAGREPEARQLLAPLLPTSRDVRVGIWLPIIARDLPRDATGSWIEQVKPALGSGAEEQLALAMVYDALSFRFPDDSARLISEARALLQRLSERPETATPAVVEALGVLLHRTGDPKGAEAAYRRALAADPNRVIALNNLASIVLEAHDLDQALALARRAVEASRQSDASSLDTLGQTYEAIANKKGAEAGKDDYKEAAATYVKAAQLNPRSTEPLFKASKCFELAGDVPEAAQCYESLLRIPNITDQAAAMVKCNLAQSLVRLKRQDQYERALSLANDSVRAVPAPATLDTLGWVQLTLGHTEEAAATFRRGQAMNAGHPALDSTLIGLALALCPGSAEQKTEARALLQSVKPGSLDPDMREQLTRAAECAGPAPGR
jgi:tetratricopeptide (TPR) repeat protein